MNTSKSDKRDSDRAKKTLYITGYDPKRTSKHLLEELFTQGGPVSEISMFDSHAFVQFQDEESAPYCLALFNEVELHGQKLRISPRHKSKVSFCYLKYLMTVREKLMTENRKIAPPDLPPRETLTKQLPREIGVNKTKPRRQRHSKQNRSKSKIRRRKANPKLESNQ